MRFKGISYMTLALPAIPRENRMLSHPEADCSSLIKTKIQDYEGLLDNL